MKHKTSYREEIIKFVKEKYNTNAEYLWRKFPSYAVLRNNKNKKWYGVIMELNYKKLDDKKEGVVDVINIKCDPNFIWQLIDEKKGFYGGYHMNRKYWISIVLDGSIELKRILNLLDMSYSLVNKK